jgi:hypothetical protein
MNITLVMMKTKRNIMKKKLSITTRSISADLVSSMH